VTITDRIVAWRRERRVSRAAWRLDQAERERAWALASTRAKGISIRKLAAAAALSPARVHRITAAADLDELDVALGELRGVGWPDPEDPDKALVVAGLPRVAAILQRIAADVDELARARPGLPGVLLP
jgi:hypothetical protein